MRRCWRVDRNTRWQCVSVAAVQREESRGSRFTGQLLFDPAAPSPSDGLAEVFYSPYPVKLVFTCQELSAGKENWFREQRFTGQEKEKLEFFVAEGSWSSSQQIFLWLHAAEECVESFENFRIDDANCIEY